MARLRHASLWGVGGESEKERKRVPATRKEEKSTTGGRTAGTGENRGCTPLVKAVGRGQMVRSVSDRTSSEQPHRVSSSTRKRHWRGGPPAEGGSQNGGKKEFGGHFNHESESENRRSIKG